MHEFCIMAGAATRFVMTCGIACFQRGVSQQSTNMVSLAHESCRSLSHSPKPELARCSNKGVLTPSLLQEMFASFKVSADSKVSAKHIGTSHHGAGHHCRRSPTARICRVCTPVMHLQLRAPFTSDFCDHKPEHASIQLGASRMKRAGAEHSVVQVSGAWKAPYSTCAWCTGGDCNNSCDSVRHCLVSPRRQRCQSILLQYVSVLCGGRYPWPPLKPLVAHLLGEVMEDFDSTAKVEVGPALPLSGGETAEGLRSRLLQLLDGFDDEAPFTIQRLAEVLLEPEKQYARLDKLVTLSLTSNAIFSGAF